MLRKAYASIFASKPRSVLGLDLQPKSIQVLALCLNKGRAHLQAYHSLPLPSGIFEGSKIQDKGLLKDALHQAISPFFCRNTKMAIAVPDAWIMHRSIQLSSLFNAHDIAQFIKMEAGNYFSHPLKDLFMDFTILGPSQEGLAMQDILLMASLKEPVLERVAIIEQAGFSVAAIDGESFALRRLLFSSGALGEEKAHFLLIQVQEEQTVWHYWQGQYMETLGAKPVPAYKEDHSAYHQTLLMNIETFLSKEEAHKIQGIFFSGHKGLCGPLARQIEAHFKIKSAAIEPFKNLHFSDQITLAKAEEEEAAAFDLATGLALRQAAWC